MTDDNLTTADGGSVQAPSLPLATNGVNRKKNEEKPKTRVSPRKKTRTTEPTTYEKILSSYCPSPRTHQTKLSFEVTPKAANNVETKCSSSSTTSSLSPASAGLFDTDEDTMPMAAASFPLVLEATLSSTPSPPPSPPPTVIIAPAGGGRGRPKKQNQKNQQQQQNLSFPSVDKKKLQHNAFKKEEVSESDDQATTKQESLTNVEVENGVKKEEVKSKGKQPRDNTKAKQLTLTASCALSPVQPTAALVTGKGTSKLAAVVKKDSKDMNSRFSNGSLDAYFPVLRRSERRNAKEIKKWFEESLDNAILNKQEDGLKVIMTEDRGRGVIATKPFHKDQFVVEYAGDKIDEAKARQRESQYQLDSSIGCYMYYFMHGDKKVCIDATAESGRLGRLLNHSRSKPNCYTKVVPIAGKPYLVLFAKRDIDLENIEDVKEFNFPGAFITNQEGSSKELKWRIIMAHLAMFDLNN